MARRAVRTWALHGGFVVLLIVATWLTSRAALAGSEASPWWPPAGLTLAYLLVAGPRFVPVAALARLVSLAIVFPELLEPWPAGLVRVVLPPVIYAIAAWVLAPRRLEHARLHELAWFVLVGVALAPAAVAVVSTVVGLDSAPDAWWVDLRVFYIGDAIGVVAVFPAALVAGRLLVGEARAPSAPLSLARRLELLAQVLGVVAIPVLLIVTSPPDEVSPLLLAAGLPLGWAALRQDVAAVAVGLLVLETTITAAAVARFGPGAELVELQAVMLLTGLGALFVAAAIRTTAASEARRHAERARWLELVGDSSDVVQRFDRDGRLTFQGGRDADELGEPATGARARPASRLALERIEAVVRARWADVGHGLSGPYDFEWWDVAPGGGRRMSTRLVPVAADGDEDGFLAITDHLVDARVLAAAGDELHPVTRLPTRDAIDAALGARLAELAVASGMVGVAMVGLDRFQLVMSTSSSAARHAVLVAVARRLRDALRPGDDLAQIGDETFALVVRADSAETATEVVERMMNSLRTPVVVDGDEVRLGSGAGLATTDRADADPDALMAGAHGALTVATESGRGRLVVVDERAGAETARRQRLIHDLRAATVADQLTVHYQPMARLDDGEIFGAEALVRWRHPQLGLLVPMQFVPLMSAEGMGRALGCAVLAAVGEELARWDGAPPFGGRVGVNVLASHVPDLLDDLVDLRARYGVDLGRLAIELTETELVDDPGRVGEALQACRELGVQIAIDDFGQGYSTLASLRELPVDVVKIDQAFVRGLPEGREDLAVVRLVVGLADELGLEVVAEGVERTDQAEALVSVGVSHGQGFLFGRPDEGPWLGDSPAGSV